MHAPVGRDRGAAACLRGLLWPVAETAASDRRRQRGYGRSGDYLLFEAASHLAMLLRFPKDAAYALNGT